MNIHESQFDEFIDEQQFQQLELSSVQIDAWIMVRIAKIVSAGT